MSTLEIPEPLLGVMLDALHCLEEAVRNGDTGWADYPAPATPADKQRSQDEYLERVDAAARLVASMMPHADFTPEQRAVALDLLDQIKEAP
jgi:hypothetical protein